MRLHEAPIEGRRTLDHERVSQRAACEPYQRKQRTKQLAGDAQRLGRTDDAIARPAKRHVYSSFQPHRQPSSLTSIIILYRY